MKYLINHTTTYDYAEPVSICHNLAHLTPRIYPRHDWIWHNLKIQPNPAIRVQRQDYFGNPVEFFSIQESHRVLAVTSSGEVEVLAAEPAELLPKISWENVRDRLYSQRSSLPLEYGFTLDSQAVRHSAELADYAAPSFLPGHNLWDEIMDLTNRIYTDFTFDNTSTSIATPLHEVLTKRRGVCQDFAHLAIGSLRSVGLAARYVSGYLLTSPPPGKPRVRGADASHAWISVFVPEFGWVDLDPTNGTAVSDRHIAIAWGRDFHDVSPLCGVLLGGRQHTVDVSVDVELLDPPSESQTPDKS